MRALMDLLHESARPFGILAMQTAIGAVAIAAWIAYALALDLLPPPEVAADYRGLFMSEASLVFVFIGAGMGIGTFRGALEADAWIFALGFLMMTLPMPLALALFSGAVAFRYRRPLARFVCRFMPGKTKGRG